jgi:hypothetical protein
MRLLARQFAGGLGRMHLRQEQADAEQRAFARRAGNLHLAAHQVGEHAGDGEPDAAAAGLRRAAAHEGLEDALQVGGRNAGAAVADVEDGHLAPAFHLEGDAAAHRELDGVAQHVDQDLAQPLLVGAHHGGKFAGRLVIEGLKPLLRACSSNMPTICCMKSGKSSARTSSGQLAALDAGDVERALDHRQQVVARPCG